MKRTARHPQKMSRCSSFLPQRKNQMVTRRIRLRKFLAVASLPAIACALLSPAFSNSSAQKLKPEEVVTRHLESIGSAKERGAIKTRIISGTSQVVFRTTPVGQ